MSGSIFFRREEEEKPEPGSVGCLVKERGDRDLVSRSEGEAARADLWVEGLEGDFVGDLEAGRAGCLTGEEGSEWEKSSSSSSANALVLLDFLEKNFIESTKAALLGT